MLHVRIDVPPIPELLEALAEGLVLLNVALMQHAADNGVELPPLYESGIVYRVEPRGREWWETAGDLVAVVHDRSGDCEDLACYRAAELRHTGEDPDAHCVIVPTARGSLHAIVGRGDGTIEDPSRVVIGIESERTGVPERDLAKRVTTDTRYPP